MSRAFSNGKLAGLLLLMQLVFASPAVAAGDRLYGVHWWDYSSPSVGSGPRGGWEVETIITNSDPWWRAPYFAPLYQQVSTTHDAAIITRVDYNWGQTVPAPSTAAASDWANRIVSEVIGPLGAYAHRWVIGNEPNLTGEANGWPSNRIEPAAYAQIYHTVRQVIKASRPQDEILFAPVSPGGVIPNVRWKDGNIWLAEAIDATLAMPGGAIDGFALHAYGNPFVGASQAVREFHDGYTSQLAVIDSRSLTHLPVYITEWNRATATTGDLAANEQVSADFLRRSLADVDVWNRTPGNQNIRGMAWFVNNQDYGGWQEYSLEWWRTRGNPNGHPGDLWTALMSASELKAGVTGTRPQADYSSDGAIDGQDWAAWRAAFGRSAWPFADGNRDGVVDAADYVIWRRAVSAGTAATAIGVPEPPATIVLATCILAAIILQRRDACRITANVASYRRPTH
jgi:Glycosyl hydrolase catalytic core